MGHASHTGYEKALPKMGLLTEIGICPLNNYGEKVKFQKEEIILQVLSTHFRIHPALTLTEISTEAILKRKIYSSYKVC